MQIKRTGLSVILGTYALYEFIFVNMMRLSIQRCVVIIIVTFVCFVARQVHSDDEVKSKQRNVLFLLGKKMVSSIEHFRNCLKIHNFFFLFGNS